MKSKYKVENLCYYARRRSDSIAIDPKGQEGANRLYADNRVELNFFLYIII